MARRKTAAAVLSPTTYAGAASASSIEEHVANERDKEAKRMANRASDPEIEEHNYLVENARAEAAAKAIADRAEAEAATRRTADEVLKKAKAILSRMEKAIAYAGKLDDLQQRLYHVLGDVEADAQEMAMLCVEARSE